MQSSPCFLSPVAEGRNITKTLTNQTLLGKQAKFPSAIGNPLFDAQATREGAAAGSSGNRFISR